jgi:hypothetical protein
MNGSERHVSSAPSVNGFTVRIISCYAQGKHPMKISLVLASCLPSGFVTTSVVQSAAAKADSHGRAHVHKSKPAGTRLLQHLGCQAFSNQFILCNPAHNTAVNENYRVVREYFDSKSVSVKRVRPVQRVATIDGYLLELGSDGYSLLKELSLP